MCRQLMPWNVRERGKEGGREGRKGRREGETVVEGQREVGEGEESALFG